MWGIKKKEDLSEKEKTRSDIIGFAFWIGIAALYYRRSCDAGNGKMVYGK